MLAGAANGLPPQLAFSIFSSDAGVALIGAVGIVGAAVVAGPVMYILHRLRSENTVQHEENKQVTVDIAERVARIDGKVDHVSSLMADHINWHMDKKGNGSNV